MHSVGSKVCGDWKIRKFSLIFLKYSREQRIYFLLFQSMDGIQTMHNVQSSQWFSKMYGNEMYTNKLEKYEWNFFFYWKILILDTFYLLTWITQIRQYWSEKRTISHRGKFVCTPHILGACRFGDSFSPSALWRYPVFNHLIDPSCGSKNPYMGSSPHVH